MPGRGTQPFNRVGVIIIDKKGGQAFTLHFRIGEASSPVASSSQEKAVVVAVSTSVLSVYSVVEKAVAVGRNISVRFPSTGSLRQSSGSTTGQAVPSVVTVFACGFEFRENSGITSKTSFCPPDYRYIFL